MGSWDIRCSLTGLPITCLDKYFYAIFVKPNGCSVPERPITYEVASMFKPFLPPFKAKYDDYGRIRKAFLTDYQRKLYTQVLRVKSRRATVEIEEFCNDREGFLTSEICMKSSEPITFEKKMKPCSLFAVHKDVYEKIMNDYPDGSSYRKKSTPEVAAQTAMDEILNLYKTGKKGLGFHGLNVDWDSTSPDRHYVAYMLREGGSDTTGHFSELASLLYDDFLENKMENMLEILRPLAELNKLAGTMSDINKTFVPNGNYGGQDSNWEELSRFYHDVGNICDKELTRDYDEEEEEGDDV